MLDKLCHYGDIVAIPFFALLVFYFSRISDRTSFEDILLFFSVSGLILDVVYTYIFLARLK
jgi:hypothetical protein